MSLPNSIKKCLSERFDINVHDAQPVSGGSINRAYRVSTNRGELFLKCNSDAPADFFDKEAEGLKLLKSAETNIRIPEVLAVESPRDDTSGFLLMEYVASGRAGDSSQFGAELAHLHQKKETEFGLNSNNYIGSLPQSNHKYSDWETFFSEERIKPQLKRAIDSGKMELSAHQKWDRLSSRLSDLLPAAEPSLVHGDLWSGNYLFDSSGRAVMIDPAVYYGHPEMDLAFSKMFGGFADEFYRGYESVEPLENGFDERVPIYNLYPLLVHVNLFAGHYISQAKNVLDRFS